MPLGASLGCFVKLAGIFLVFFGRCLASFVSVRSVEVVRVEHTGKDVEHVSYFQIGMDNTFAQKKAAVL